MEFIPLEAPGNDPFTDIGKYRHVYDKYQGSGVIDLDKHLKAKSSFQIHRMEDFVRSIEGIEPPSRQGSYLIGMIDKGTGEKTIGGHRFPVKDHTLYIVPRRAMHSGRFCAENIHGYLISFDIDFFVNCAFPRQFISNRFVLKNEIIPFVHLSTQQGRGIKDIFEAILTEHTTGLCAKREMIALKLLELLIACDRLFSYSERNSAGLTFHPLIERFYELVEREYLTNKSVKFYADSLNVHPNYLNIILKKYSGQSAKESINNRIIQESKLLLSFSCLIVKEIAYRLGFDDANYFSTFFQKYTGTTPVLFRQAYLNCYRAS